MKEMEFDRKNTKKSERKKSHALCMAFFAFSRDTTNGSANFFG